jgi:hypothetical protein
MRPPDWTFQVATLSVLLTQRNAIDCGKLPLREERVGAKRPSDHRG